MRYRTILLIVSLLVTMPVYAGRIIQDADIWRAQENLRQHAWAQQYLTGLQKEMDQWAAKITPQFLEDFIPETTPGSTSFLPCPACRDQGKPYLPGNWQWSPGKPEEITCLQCGTAFPNPQYAETVVVETTWGKPQTFSYVGGEPLPTFSYPHGRASFSGSIRARKVEWMSSFVRRAADAYALTGQPAYADLVRRILLRFSETYPYWLLHSGYGEYADMAPAEAAPRINALPKPETVYPPNKPDGKLHTGYWTAGRAGAVGMEGVFVRRVTEAYDLTRNAKTPEGQPLYSGSDRRQIEEKLLKESTMLLVADQAINNKSMGNRSAAGMVGLVMNDPSLVRFGMEGFFRTIDEWFLPDGGTPESPAYALMALGGINDFAQALRGYTDPPEYRDEQGKRYDHFDPYHDTRYGKIWEGMFLSLQGDLHYPPFADSYESSGMSPAFAELLADNYPENGQYFALLHEVLRGDWHKAYAPYAIYYADPERETRSVPELTLPSHLFPALKLGFMRTGADGRESLLLLSASDWGSHHHQDGLNLYYWKNGHELWSDLGYLWNHPDKQKTVRTFAHNTVLLDEKDQITTGRKGEVRYFLDTARVKAMRAASNAYPTAKTYERASTLIDHGSGRSYVVDVFWVEGGATQDYVYHGPNSPWELVNITSTPPAAQNPRGVWETLKSWFAPTTPEPLQAALPVKFQPGPEALYDLTDIQTLDSSAPAMHALRWNFPDKRAFTVWHVPTGNEQVFIGQGWGQRDHRNSDRGAKLPYVIRRTQGAGQQTFVSVLEEHPAGQSFIRQITPLTAENGESVALQIDTGEGRDYVVLNREPRETVFSTPDGRLETNALLAVLSVREGKETFHVVDSGKVRLTTK